jgi:ABC-type transporter Mla MlaB component
VQLTTQGYRLLVDGDLLEIDFAKHYDPDLHGCGWASAAIEQLPDFCLQLVIDMAGFNRVDSRLFTGLIQIQRHLKEQGVTTITLRSVGPRVRVGLDMLRMSSFFTFENRRDTPPHTTAVSG